MHACYTHSHILSLFPFCLESEYPLPTKELMKKKTLESCSVHTVRTHFPVCTCINRLLIVFRFFLFFQLLKHGFCCPHIFKKSSFILQKQHDFLYLLQLPASETIGDTAQTQRFRYIYFNENQHVT